MVSMGFKWRSVRVEKTARARLPCNQPGRANKAVIRGGEGRSSVQRYFSRTCAVHRGSLHGRYPRCCAQTGN